MLHTELGLSLLKDRQQMSILKLVFKYSKKEENVEMYRPDMVLQGRHKVKMKILYTNKDRVIKSPYYLVVNLWNQLERDIQTIINKVDSDYYK